MKIQNLVRLHLGRIDVSDMTDEEDATGTYEFEGALPKGFLPIAGAIVCTKAFAGQSAVAAELGTSTDADAYVDSGSVLTKGLINGLTGADMDADLNDDTDVVLTITGNASFAALTAGEVDVVLHCIDLNEETIIETQ